jgi:hypothetical protein
MPTCSHQHFQGLGFQQNQRVLRKNFIQQTLSMIPMDATGLTGRSNRSNAPLLVVLEENDLGLRIATHGLQVHVHEGLGGDLES